MSAAAGTIPPPVSWAQRNELLYVIIDVECVDVEHKVTENTLHFKGINCLDASKKYDVTLNFLHPVDPERVTVKNIARCVEFTIYKKEAGPYWPSLTSDKTKLHFLKANFSKWKDESDDEDDAPRGAGGNFNDFLGSYNDKIDDFNIDGDGDAEDSDDDNIPSLSNNDEDDDEEEGKEKEKDNDKTSSGKEDK